MTFVFYSTGRYGTLCHPLPASLCRLAGCQSPSLPQTTIPLISLISRRGLAQDGIGRISSRLRTHRLSTLTIAATHPMPTQARVHKPMIHAPPSASIECVRCSGGWARDIRHPTFWFANPLKLLVCSRDPHALPFACRYTDIPPTRDPNGAICKRLEPRHMAKPCEDEHIKAAISNVICSHKI